MAVFDGQRMGGAVWPSSRFHCGTFLGRQKPLTAPSKFTLFPRMSQASSPAPQTQVPTVAIVPPALVVAPRPVSGHRLFSNDANTLGAQWAQHAIAPLPWVADPATAANPGVEGGFWVVSTPWRGYAKPRNAHAADPMLRPVAAYEKIASDLAYQLDLPVPPVTLFERINAPPGEARYHSVSAPPFAQLERWEVIYRIPPILDIARKCAGPAMSAMVAFDTWLHCTDHANHPGNLLVTMGTASTPKCAFAWIDYGWSLTHTWRTEGFNQPFIAPMYDPLVSVDIVSLRETISAIELVPDALVEAIVCGIPGAFLSESDRDIIVAGLKHRRNQLRQIIAVAHPGVK